MWQGQWVWLFICFDCSLPLVHFYPLSHHLWQQPMFLIDSRVYRKVVAQGEGVSHSPSFFVVTHDERHQSLIAWRGGYQQQKAQGPWPFYFFYFHFALRHLSLISLFLFSAMFFHFSFMQHRNRKLVILIRGENSSQTPYCTRIPFDDDTYLAHKVFLYHIITRCGTVCSD